MERPINYLQFTEGEDWNAHIEITILTHNNTLSLYT